MSEAYTPDYLVDDGYFDRNEREKRTKLSAPIGLKEAVEALGLEPTRKEIQKLRRRIQAREKLIQCKILTQSGVHGKFFTTLAVLKDRMPELFFDEEISELAAYVRGLKNTIEELHQRDDMLRDEIVELKKKIA